MFDTHVHRSAPPYPQSIHSETHEHRAPTDESVKLLREMEQKAQDSIMLAIRCDDNAFKFLAVVLDDEVSFRRTLRIQYSLNGVRRDIVMELKPWPQNFEEAAAHVREQIIKSLAVELTVNVVKEHALRNLL